MKCPKCGADMVLRDGKYGKFYGCSRFPKCRATKKYGGPKLTKEACQSGELQCWHCPYQGMEDRCFLLKSFISTTPP